MLPTVMSVPGGADRECVANASEKGEGVWTRRVLLYHNVIPPHRTDTGP